jgi:TonB family protein
MYSVLFHIFIAGLFLLIKFQAANIPVREYFEVIFEDRIEIPRPREPIATTPRPNEPAPTGTNVPAPPVRPERIDVPTVTTPDFDSPVDISHLPERTDRNIWTPNFNNTIADDLIAGNNRPLTPIESTVPGGTSQTTSNVNANLDGLAEQIRAQRGSISDVRIEGEVNNRTIIRRVLPQFPEEVRRNGMVTIQFTVLENGSVSNAIITRKSEPEFEHASLVAIRQWAFNQADRTHTGQITFNFVLE